MCIAADVVWMPLPAASSGHGSNPNNPGRFSAWLKLAATYKGTVHHQNGLIKDEVDALGLAEGFDGTPGPSKSALVKFFYNNAPPAAIKAAGKQPKGGDPNLWLRAHMPAIKQLLGMSPPQATPP
jgi:hypothetical protein